AARRTNTPADGAPKPVTLACARQSAQLAGAAARSRPSASVTARPSSYQAPDRIDQPLPRPPSGAIARVNESENCGGGGGGGGDDEAPVTAKSSNGMPARCAVSPGAPAGSGEASLARSFATPPIDPISVPPLISSE